MTKRKADSLNKRYLAKVLASILLLPIGLITGAIIPRALGPILYGNFNFLTTTFSKITEFIQVGFSSAYYTKLSQDLSEKGIIRFYFGFRIILSLIIIILTLLIFLFNFQSIIWPEQETKYVFMALLMALLMIFSNTTSSTIDAFGYTVKREWVSISVKIIGLGCLLL